MRLPTSFHTRSGSQPHSTAECHSDAVGARQLRAQLHQGRAAGHSQARRGSLASDRCSARFRAQHEASAGVQGRVPYGESLAVVARVAEAMTDACYAYECRSTTTSC